ncbi:hypothetical protein ACFVG9_01960 [Saccharothrix carnea]
MTSRVPFRGEREHQHFLEEEHPMGCTEVNWRKSSRSSHSVFVR